MTDENVRKHEPQSKEDLFAILDEFERRLTALEELATKPQETQ